MCSECMLLLDSCSELSAVKEVNQSIEVFLVRWLGMPLDHFIDFGVHCGILI